MSFLSFSLAHYFYLVLFNIGSDDFEFGYNHFSNSNYFI